MTPSPVMSVVLIIFTLLSPFSLLLLILYYLWLVYNGSMKFLPIHLLSLAFFPAACCVADSASLSNPLAAGAFILMLATAAAGMFLTIRKLRNEYQRAAHWKITITGAATTFYVINSWLAGVLIMTIRHAK